MKTSIENKILLVFGVSVLALIGIGWLSYRTTTNLITTENWISHTHEVIATLERGLAILTDAETSQRGFLLTGDERFLQDSQKAQAQIAEWTGNIRKLTADNLEQQQRLDKLEPLISQRLIMLNSRIKLRQEQGLQAAANSVATREGKQVMDQIWLDISEMRDAENELLLKREQTAQAGAQASLLIILGGGVFTSLVGLGAVMMIRHDLRLRKRAQEELDRFFTLSLDFLCIASADGHFKRVSPVATEILGWSSEEFLSRPFVDFVHPDDRTATLREVERQVVTGEKVLNFENRYRHRDGSWRVLSWRSMPHPGGLMYAIARDVTAERSTQKALRESEARYRTLFNSIDEGFCIIEMIFDVQQKPVDYRFLEVNPSFEKQTGLRDAVGKTMRELAPEHEAHWFEMYGRIAETGETARFQNRAEQLHRTYDVYAFRFGEPKNRQVAILFNDITKSKEAEVEIFRSSQEIKTANEKLQTANKELESFSYSVSHDLRAPLRHIDGFVDLLTKHIGKTMDEQSRRYLNIIADSARQMGQLIDDLLVFSRMSRGELRLSKVALNSLLDEAVSMLQVDIKDRKVVWKIGALREVDADPAMLRQVWMNLIGNAVKYTRTRNPAEIEVGCDSETDDEFVFYVRDNGVGFDMQYLDKLFGVFQRLHRSEEFEGTGIGLANVRRIISRHGGRTWAEGKIDCGATFFFSLPKKHQPKLN
jgi:PAS domain S-box-containing protein